VNETDTKRLAWGFKRLVPDENTIVGWGARCIFDEFMAGGQGVVWDRQDAFGPKDLFDAVLSPSIDSWFNKARKQLDRWDSGADKIITDDLLLEHGDEWYRVLIKGSPQSSYGYLYVTALLSKHEAP
jgi:hypothetical protein